MGYNFNRKFVFGHWFVEIDETQSYGYFQHEKTGTEGGLWFERVANENGEGSRLELVDYDGVFELAPVIAQGLRDAGFYLNPEFF